MPYSICKLQQKMEKGYFRSKNTSTNKDILELIDETPVLSRKKNRQVKNLDIQDRIQVIHKIMI